MSGALSSLCGRLFDAIRVECPQAWEELTLAGAGLRVTVALDGERFAIAGTDRGLRVEGAKANGAGAHVEGSVDALRRLIMGETDLVASIEREEIFVAGDPAELARLDRAVWLTVAGAARSESVGPLLDELWNHSPKRTPKGGNGLMSKKNAAARPKTSIFCDVAIFGAGISGLTAAHELAERNFRVAVIDPGYAGGDPPRDVVEKANPGLGGMAKSQWCFLPVGAQGAARGPMSRDEMRAALPPPEWSPIKVSYDIKPTGAQLGSDVRDATTGTKRKSLAAELKDLASYVLDTSRDQKIDLSIVYAASNDDDLDALGAALDEALERALSTLQHGAGVSDEGVARIRREAVRRTERGRRASTAFNFDLVPLATDLEPNTLAISINLFSLPGEHGFRFFPSFYRHIFDTLKRIPISRLVPGHESRDGTVFDNLVPTQEIGYVGRAKSRSVRVPRRPIRSTEEARAVIDGFLDEAGYSESDIVLLGRSFLKYMTSSRLRREREYEGLSWYEFVEGDRFSPRARFLHETAPGTLGGLFGSAADARTQGTIALQLMKDSLAGADPGTADMLLNGPTDLAWFAHWYWHLASQGVTVYRGTLKEIDPDGEPVAVLEDGSKIEFKAVHAVVNEKVRFVVALPLREMTAITKDLVDRMHEAHEPESSARDFVQLLEFANVDFDSELKKANPSGPLRHLSGIQYFFDQEIRLWRGHTQYLDAEYGLTSISQPQFWRIPEDLRSGFRTVLSVDIGIWEKPPISDGSSSNVVYPWQRTPAFLAEQIWQQLETQHAGDFPDPWPKLPTPYAYHVDDNLVLDRDGNIADNRSPFLVNEKGRFRKRPGWNGRFDADDRAILEYHVAFDRWVMAGTHMQTATRINSMEAACESGRRAVNALLRHLEITGEPCAVWDPEDYELDALDVVKEIDRDLCSRKCPHPLDILRP